MSDFPQKVTDHERRDYPGMVTPTELRNLALGLENSNHAAEETARLFKAAPEMLRVLREWREPGDCGCDTALCRDTCPPAKTRAAIARATGADQ